MYERRTESEILDVSMFDQYKQKHRRKETEVEERKPLRILLSDYLGKQEDLNLHVSYLFLSRYLSDLTL